MGPPSYQALHVMNFQEEMATSRAKNTHSLCGTGIRKDLTIDM